MIIAEVSLACWSQGRPLVSREHWGCSLNDEKPTTRISGEGIAFPAEAEHVQRPRGGTELGAELEEAGVLGPGE